MNKALQIALAILIYFLLGLGVILSLLPLIQWWMGILSLLAGGALWFFVLRRHPDRDQRVLQLPLLRLLKPLTFMFLFGFVIHLGCSVVSAVKVSSLRSECNEEKEKVFRQLQNELNGKAPKADN